MLVVDASVIVDLILDLPPHAAAIGQRLRAESVWASSEKCWVQWRVLSGKCCPTWHFALPTWHFFLVGGTGLEPVTAGV